MFHLVSGCVEYWFAKRQYQVLILGLDFAGKTTLLAQIKKVFAGGAPPSEQKIPPTVGLNVERVTAGGSNVLFWDLGGQVGLRSIWDKYYADAHAVLYVIDSCDAERLHEAKREIERATEHSDLHGSPVLILANKQDKADCLSVDRVKGFLNLRDKAKAGDNIVHVMGVSAMQGDGVQAALGWLLHVVPQLPRTKRIGTAAR